MPGRVPESMTNLAERPPSQPVAAPTSAVPTAVPEVALRIPMQASWRIRRVRVRVDPWDAYGKNEVVALAHEARVRGFCDDEHDVLESAVRALVPDARDADARARRPPWRDVHVDLHRLPPRTRLGGWCDWGLRGRRGLLGVERARDAVAMHRAEVEVLQREMEWKYPVFRRC